MNTQFDDLSALFGRLDVPVPVSEAHGLLCGLLCAQPTAMAKKAWLIELLEAANIDSSAVANRASDIKMLDNWFNAVVDTLHASELTFETVGPADSAPLPLRLRALGDFCAGFTYGVGLGTAGRGNKTLPPDTRELIEDFNAIDSNAGDSVSSAKQAQDDEENAFMELQEYVRVGVLLIHEEFKPVSAGEAKIH